MTEDFVTLSMEEYDIMKRDISWLQCLEAAGVDNWEGHIHALDLYYTKYPDEDPTK